MEINNMLLSHREELLTKLATICPREWTEIQIGVPVNPLSEDSLSDAQYITAVKQDDDDIYVILEWKYKALHQDFDRYRIDLLSDYTYDTIRDVLECLINKY